MGQMHERGALWRYIYQSTEAPQGTPSELPQTTDQNRPREQRGVFSQ